MIEPLNTYGYIENDYMKPTACNYEVTISSNDHVITIEDDGSLLAVLGLQLVNQELSLTGKEGEAIASVTLPQATGIEDIKYDKATHSLIITVQTASGEKETYSIDISDLVDVYQSGNGIEISEDEEGNKTINVKINDDNKDVLSADENGLAINLTDYAKVADTSGYTDAIAALEKKIQSEAERADAAENDLSSRLTSEINRATTRENDIANNLATLNENVVTSINNLNNNIATIAGDLNNAIFNEAQRAVARENEIEGKITAVSAKTQDIDKKVDKEDGKGLSTNDFTDSYKQELDDLDTAVIYAYIDAQDGILQGEIDALSAVTSGKVDQAVYDEKVAGIDQEIAEIKKTIPSVSGFATEQWVEDKGYATEQWVEDKNYLTEHQSLSAYSTSDEIADTYQVKGDYALKGDIADFVTAQWVEDKGYATEQWVEDKGYLTEHQSLSGYSTTEEMKAICVTEDEYTLYKADLLNQISDTYQVKGDYALKSDIADFATEQWVEDKGYLTQVDLTDYAKIDDIKNSYATKTELNDGLATKVSQSKAEEIAKNYVDEVLTAYTPTSGIASMINSAVDEAKVDAVGSAKTYSDQQLISANAYTDDEIQKLDDAYSKNIEENANKLGILSVCNDGVTYDTNKAMDSGTGTGVVDELYRLLHSMLKDMDENDLTALNTALKNLIGK